MNSIKIRIPKLCAIVAALLFTVSLAPPVTTFASITNGVPVADTYDVWPDGTTLLPNWGVKTDDLLTGVSVESGVLRISNEDTAEAVKVSTFSIHSDGETRNSGSNLNPLEALIEFNVRKSTYATTYFEQVATNSGALYRISFEANGVVRVHNCRTTTAGLNGNYTSQAGAYKLNEFFNIKIETRPNDSKFSVYVNDVPVVEGAGHATTSVKTTRWLRFAIDARGDDESKIVSFELADFFMRDTQKSSMLSDAGAVSAAAELLTYGRLLAANTNKQNVVTGLALIDALAITSPVPTGGSVTEDVEIDWQSDNDDVIDSATGNVTRPADGAPDANVTLTATIRKGTETAAKTFAFKVLKITNEPLEVASRISIIGSVGNETNQIILPATDPAGEYDAVITWQSDLPDVIASDGTVLSKNEEAIVTLTATVSVEGFPDFVKSFKVHIIPDTGEENILTGGNATTNGLVVYHLPSNAVDGDISTVWKSSIGTGSTLTIAFGQAVRVEKIVLRELSAGVKSFRLDLLSNSIWQSVYTGNRSETGAAIINCTPAQATGVRLFIAQASGEVSLAELEAFGSADIGQAAKSDAAALTLGDTSNVTDDIPLPLTGAKGSEISWTSSNTDVVKIEGALAKVTRPHTASSAKIAATLTAEITKGGYTETKQFIIRIVPIVEPSGNNNAGSTGSKSGGSGGAPAMPPAFLANTDPIPKAGAGENQVQPFFVDVQSGNWEYPYIQKLYHKKIITGVGEHTFEPNRSITREEFVTIIVKALGLANASTAPLFDDVPAGEWYTPFIAAAYENGIITGNSATSFGVGDNVTRQEMATMIYRAAKIAGIGLNTEAGVSSFSDDGEISGWAKDAVNILHSAKIINGIDGAFRPGATATRAQAAKMACALLQDKS